MSLLTEESNYIDVRGVSKTFTEQSNELNVLSSIDFSVKKGEFISIVGGSGCGKRTLLRILSGLDTKHEGTVSIDGKEVTKPDKTRGVIGRNGTEGKYSKGACKQPQDTFFG